LFGLLGPFGLISAELGELLIGVKCCKNDLPWKSFPDIGFGIKKPRLFCKVALAGDLSLQPPEMDSYLLIFRFASFLLISSGFED
jgi:hypothetical protein